MCVLKLLQMMGIINMYAGDNEYYIKHVCYVVKLLGEERQKVAY